MEDEPSPQPSPRVRGSKEREKEPQNKNKQEKYNDKSCPPLPEGEGLGVRAEISKLAGSNRQIPKLLWFFSTYYAKLLVTNPKRY